MLAWVLILFRDVIRDYAAFANKYVVFLFFKAIVQQIYFLLDNLPPRIGCLEVTFDYR